MVTESRLFHQDGGVGPTSLPIDRYVTAIRTDAALLADAARRAGPDGSVPTCPEWTVGDLVRHLGGVQRWATGYVADGRREVWAVDLDEVVGAWPGDDALLEWFTVGAEALAVALEQADPDLECWTFLRATSPLAMWARRQAHESAIHRVDAELAAGPSTSAFDPTFAADGVDELLTCFVVRSKTGLRRRPRRTMRVVATDAPGDWLVHIGPDGVVTQPGSPGADAEVHGPAADLDLLLWNRGDGRDGVQVDGDPAVLELFLDRVHVRWS